MICPYCAYEKTRVVGTDKSLQVKRLRKCLKCGHTFPTTEAIDFDKYWREYAEATFEEPIKKQNK